MCAHSHYLCLSNTYTQCVLMGCFPWKLGLQFIDWASDRVGTRELSECVFICVFPTACQESVSQTEFEIRWSMSRKCEMRHIHHPRAAEQSREKWGRWIERNRKKRKGKEQKKTDNFAVSESGKWQKCRKSFGIQSANLNTQHNSYNSPEDYCIQ